MKKTRKRLFAFSGLFVLVAQVLVMALCSIPAIAVTREETNRTLFNNEHGSATISYEEMESGGLNWTINLQKAAHDTATRFMVAMTADGQAIMPENVQTVMQSAPEISFTAGNGEGLMLAGLQEGAAGSGAGSAVITYQTSGNYGQMAVVPKLVTVGDTVSDLLAGNPGVVYDIPVKEEPAATEEAVTGELPLNDGQTATTETTEADAVESTTDSQDAEITESTTESTATDEATEVTETTESSDAVAEGEVVESGSEDSTEATESSSEAEDETGDSLEAIRLVVPSNDDIGSDSSNWTSLNVNKTWDGEPVEGEDTVYFQLMRKKKNDPDSSYEAYGDKKSITYGKSDLEWSLLPRFDDANKDPKNPYVYTAVEVNNEYYDVTQGETLQSVIESLNQVRSCSETSVVARDDPSYFIADTKQNWVIWTIDYMTDDEKKAFLTNVYNFGMANGASGQPFHDFASDYEAGIDQMMSKIDWISGTQETKTLGVTVLPKAEGGYDIEVDFKGTKYWEHYMYGGNSTKTLQFTNTYIPQKDINITIKKIWEDFNNKFGTREDIELVLEQSLDGGNTWSEYMYFPITSSEATKFSKEYSKEYSVPSRVNGKDATYQIKELVKDGDSYTERNVTGYEDPAYSEPTVLPADGVSELSVKNTLRMTDLIFTKVRNDANNSPLSDVLFTLLDENGKTLKEVPSGEGDGAVRFNGLPVGKYTLVESVPSGYNDDVSSWNFEVIVGDNGELTIDWGDARSPFKDGEINNGILVNNLKPFQFVVNKVDDLGNSLEGATFELSGDNLKDPLTIVGGSKFEFNDLTPGTYTLTETDAPDGYAKLTETFEIVISVNENGEIEVTINGGDPVPVDTKGENNIFTYKVANKKLVPLPATGGPGTLLFFVMGILAIAVTGIYFVSRQKQEVA